MGDLANQAEALKNLAEFHQATGDLATAKDYADRALTLATQLNIPLKADCEALLESLENP